VAHNGVCLTVVSKTDDYFLESVGGCLLGNLALEVSTLNLEFKDEIKSYFLAWEKALAKILETKYGKDTSVLLSKEYVALTQGAIMMMNLFDSPESYLSIGEKITQLL
jgi:hypothetical protein